MFVFLTTHFLNFQIGLVRIPSRFTPYKTRQETIRQRIMSIHLEDIPQHTHLFLLFGLSAGILIVVLLLRRCILRRLLLYEWRYYLAFKYLCSRTTRRPIEDISDLTFRADRGCLFNRLHLPASSSGKTSRRGSDTDKKHPYGSLCPVANLRHHAPSYPLCYPFILRLSLYCVTTTYSFHS